LPEIDAPSRGELMETAGRSVDTAVDVAA
jgi:hypothetical protein